MSSIQDSSDLFFPPESRDVRETGDKTSPPYLSNTLAWKNRQIYRVQMYLFVINGLTGILFFDIFCSQHFGFVWVIQICWSMLCCAMLHTVHSTFCDFENRHIPANPGLFL